MVHHMRERELPLLLNADETAEILRTTRTAVYALAARGQLPGVTRIGRRILVRSADLLAWLDQRLVTPLPRIRLAFVSRNHRAPWTCWSEGPVGDGDTELASVLLMRPAVSGITAVPRESEWRASVPAAEPSAIASSKPGRGRIVLVPCNLTVTAMSSLESGKSASISGLRVILFKRPALESKASHSPVKKTVAGDMRV